MEYQLWVHFSYIFIRLYVERQFVSRKSEEKSTFFPDIAQVPLKRSSWNDLHSILLKVYVSAWVDVIFCFNSHFSSKCDSFKIC